MSDAATTVKLEPYDPAWPLRFAVARDELVRVVPEAEIQHIGSTSVPGLSSRDTIDVALGVPDVQSSLTRAIRSRLEDLGYDYVPTSFADDPHHAFFSRTVDGARTEHLHVMTLGREPMVGHPLFRDFLRANPDVGVRYEREKQRLARRFGDDRDEYVRLKMPVVEALMVEARSWRGRHAAPSD